MQAVIQLQPNKIFAAFVAAWMLSAVTNPALGETKPAASVPSTDLIQPADLAASLKSSPQLLILQVGFRTMYDQSHIPGSDFAGPGNTPAGLQVLRDRVASLPKDTAIIIYCGCCPWSRCPNIAAAYDTLHGLVLMAMSSDEFVAVTAQQMKEGSKMPRADWKQMKAYFVPLPPSGLLSNFDGVIQPIVEQLKSISFANQKLRTARDLLLPRLMSGELAV